MPQTTLKHFNEPDEVRIFPHGRFEIIHIAGVTLGRATYQPGWKWSEHNAPSAGTAFCHVPHTGTVVSGHGVVPYETGERLDLYPGQVFHITSHHITLHRPRTTVGLRATSLTCRCMY